MAELWALLHWLYPEVFTDKTSELFRDAFDLTRGKISTSFMDNARRLLELIMLRRMKSSPSVNINLPPKTEVLLFVPLTPMQRFWYRRLLTRTDRGLLEELFQDARGKELKVLKAEKEEDSLTAPDLNNLELLEGVNPANEDAWEEHREIVKKAIVQESQQGPKSSAWTKLMNLVMQLRKVCLPSRETEDLPLNMPVLQSSLSAAQLGARPILPWRACHPGIWKVHLARQAYIRVGNSTGREGPVLFRVYNNAGPL